jgi:hypothetical protein
MLADKNLIKIEKLRGKQDIPTSWDEAGIEKRR